MEFTTSDLLKNASFSAKHYKRFDHYMTLLKISKGIVPANVNVESIKELDKLNFKIDSLTDYITNIFDYDLYIKDGSPNVIYVLEAATRQRVGTLTVDMSGEELRFVASPVVGGGCTSPVVVGCTEDVVSQ